MVFNVIVFEANKTFFLTSIIRKNIEDFNSFLKRRNELFWKSFYLNLTTSAKGLFITHYQFC